MKFKRAKTVLISLFAGVCLSVGAAAAQSYGQGDATLYSMTQYGGFSQQISRAEENLSNRNFKNRASSLRANGGAWILCQAERFSGPCLVARQDIRDLREFGFQGSVASMGPLPANMNFRHGTVVSRNILGEFVFFETDTFGNLNFSHNSDQYYRYNGSGGYGQYNGQQDDTSYRGPSRPDIIVYTEQNYGGASLGINTDIGALNSVGFDDRISSIEIKRGDWEFCADPYYQGRCKILDSDEILTSRLKLNDNISSIRRLKNGAAKRQREEEAKLLRTADVVVYKDGNFSGEFAIITQSITHLDDDTLNDEISSIRIRRGSWQVCEHPNFGGRCQTLTKDTAKLGVYKLNDNVSSIKKISN